MGSCGKPKGQCTCGSKTMSKTYNRYRTDNKQASRKFGNQRMRYAGGGNSKAAVQKYAQRYRNIGLNVRVVPHVGGYSLYFGEQRQGMARPPTIKPQIFNKEWRTLQDQKNTYKRDGWFSQMVGAQLPVKDIRAVDQSRPIPGNPDMGKSPMFDSRGKRIYLSAYTGKPVEHKLRRMIGDSKYYEMLEVLPPAYFMANRSHDSSFDQWVHHNEGGDPLYRTPEGDLVNTSYPEAGYEIVKESMEDTLNAFWDFEHGPIPEDAPEWVGGEYIQHMPTGIKISREDIASGRATDTLASMGLGATPITRTRINTLEGGIAGGYAAMDNMDGRMERQPDGSYKIIKEPANTSSEVPYRYEVLEYMTRMPDNFETFLMQELSSHTLTGESITTQYAMLEVPGEKPIVVSKEVIVNDIDTWIKPENFESSYEYNGIDNFRDDWKKYNSSKNRNKREDMKGRLTTSRMRGGKRRQGKKKRYNHLQWYAPGNLKIVDKNVNGIDDRVE